MPYPSLRGGGAGFALGTPNNIFGEASGNRDLSTINPAAGLAAAEGVRDAYQLANPLWDDAYTDREVNIILYYTDSGDDFAQYQRLVGTTWTNNGPPVIALMGAQGIAGGILSFASESALALAMSTQANRDLLELNTPIELHVGNDVVEGLLWKGEPQPTALEYNRNLWGPYTARFASDSVEFGEATNASSLAHRLSVFDRQSNVERTLIYSVLGTSGSERPLTPGLSASQTLFDRLNQNGEMSALSTVHDIPSGTLPGDPVETTAQVLTLDFADVPNLVRVEGWVGTDDTGLKVIDRFIDITSGTSVGQIPLQINSQSSAFSNQQYLTRITTDIPTRLRGQTNLGVFDVAIAFVGRVFNEAGLLLESDVGTEIGDIVQLEDVGGNAGLPAVDGSQLTGVNVGGNYTDHFALAERENIGNNWESIGTFSIDGTQNQVDFIKTIYTKRNGLLSTVVNVRLAYLGENATHNGDIYFTGTRTESSTGTYHITMAATATAIPNEADVPIEVQMERTGSTDGIRHNSTFGKFVEKV